MDINSVTSSVRERSASYIRPKGFVFAVLLLILFGCSDDGTRGQTASYAKISKGGPPLIDDVKSRQSSANRDNRYDSEYKPNQLKINRKAEDARYVVAELDRAPSADLRAALSTAGFREIAYRPLNSLILERVSGKERPLGSTLQPIADIVAVFAYSPLDRVSREFALENLEKRLPGKIPVLIHMMPAAGTESLLQLLSARKLAVLGNALAGKWRRISTLVPAKQVSSLVEELGVLPEVFYVERIHRMGFFNDRSTGTIQSGVQGAHAGVTPIWEQGIRGEGHVVGIIDSGLDVDACWFRDGNTNKLPITNTWAPAVGYGNRIDDSHRKIIAYDFLFSCDQFPTNRDCELPTDITSWDNHGHGTHCAGSMVGDGQNARNNGIAPAAKIVVQDGGATVDDCSDMPGLGCPVIDLYPIFKQAFDQGARIHNNSYGDNENASVPNQSNYSARSQDVDRFMWDHKDMLIVFAAGNSGARNRDFSVGSPSTNKNGLSIGSVRTSVNSTSDDNISDFSSRGWTADGRIKPDLMAPGCTVSAGSDMNIASNNCGEDSGCGTSYAAPIAAGAATLVRQYFTDGYYPSGTKNPSDAITPSAALLKGMLINSAVSMTGRDNSGRGITPIPSNEQGWGRIQLDRTLLFQGASRKLFVDDHRTGFIGVDSSSVSYTITGVSPIEAIKITLVWTDYPGTVDSAPISPSVDDIDNLNAPQLVNDLDLTVTTASGTYLGNNFAEGISVPGSVADRRNNVEQVLFNTQVTEDILVTVTATNVVQAEQDFALVVTGQWQTAGQPPPDDTADLDAGQIDSSQASDAESGVPPVRVEDSSTVSPQPPRDEGPSWETITNSQPQAGAPAAQPPIIGSFEEGISIQPVGSQWQNTNGNSSSGCTCGIVNNDSQSSGWLIILGTAVVLIRIRRRKRRPYAGKPARSNPA